MNLLKFLNFFTILTFYTSYSGACVWEWGSGAGVGVGGGDGCILFSAGCPSFHVRHTAIPTLFPFNNLKMN